MAALGQVADHCPNQGITNMMFWLQIMVLAVVQGLAELLPVSSTAHVIVAEKLFRMDPSAPRMMLLLAMLHTGSMFAVIAYFRRAWKQTFFASREQFKQHAIRLLVASAMTAIVGGPLILGIEETPGVPDTKKPRANRSPARARAGRLSREAAGTPAAPGPTAKICPRRTPPTRSSKWKTWPATSLWLAPPWLRRVS